MPGISAIIALISLDVCAALVSGNRVYSSLSVTDATNATPIVVTTAVAHAVPSSGSHVVVSGVGGNLAANNTAYENAVPDTDIVAWLAVPTATDKLALYTIQPDGTTAAVAGSGNYTTGGTVSIALVDGQILLGREHVFEQSSPPRVVFIPTASQFAGKDVYNRSRVSGSPSAEQKYQTQIRAIASEKKTFEIHVWGQATPPDPRLDFDATETLYQQVVRSSHLLMPGTYEIGSGNWADQTGNSSQLVKAGHEFVFSIQLGTPVLDKLLPLAPSDVSAQVTTNLQPADGSTSEVGCSD